MANESVMANSLIDDDNIVWSHIYNSVNRTTRLDNRYPWILSVSDSAYLADVMVHCHAYTAMCAGVTNFRTDHVMWLIRLSYLRKI